MWPSSSVPTEGAKWNRRWKLPEPQGFPALFQAKNTNVPIPGYLFSMMIEQDGTQRREKDVVKRYIRLTYLVKPILDLVDESRIAFSPAVELSFLTKTEQAELWDIIQCQDCTPSLSQAVRLKKLSQKGALTPDRIYEIMREEKANQKERIRIEVSQLRKYFPKDYTARQLENTILQLLEANCQKRFLAPENQKQM